MSLDNKAKYGKEFITPLVEVHWSQLAVPDTKFGNPNHSITVICSDALNVLLLEAVKALNGKKINGLREYEGKRLMKFKNSLACKEGKVAFPITGADLRPTDMIPFRPDLVKVMVTPVFIERDSSISFYMKDIQLIERRFSGEVSVAFTKVGD